MKPLRAALALIVLLAPAAPAGAFEVKERLWAEVWGQTSYRRTNLGADTGAYREIDFLLTTVAANLGLRFPVRGTLYLDPYFNFDILKDSGRDPWNHAYWNNHFKYGPGLRLRYEYENDRGLEAPVSIRNFWAGLFTEYLIMTDSLNQADDRVSELVRQGNYRLGFDGWLSVETLRRRGFSAWTETWGELVYNNTNFQFKGTHDYWPLTVQPRVGLKYKYRRAALQPYYTVRLQTDLDDASWNHEVWFNNYQYGPGIRLLLDGSFIKKGLSVFVYAESVNMGYLPKVDDARRRNISTYDNKVNLEFYVPFGAVTFDQYAD